MKATAIAHPNIALIKYWGNRDPRLNLPANNSISMVMSGATTKTTIAFGKSLKNEIRINGARPDAAAREKLTRHIRYMQKLANDSSNFRVESENDFPTASGLASSASGYAALTKAAASALEMGLDERQLSIVARRGSGSAARSIHSGFVEWLASDKDEESYAVQLAPPEHLDILDIVAVTDLEKKKVPSSSGHGLAKTSPLYKVRLAELRLSIPKMRNAILSKDFTKVGELSERDCLSMHSVMMTSRPSLVYWSAKTEMVIRLVADLRRAGVECYFTIDAGPNVHILAQTKDKKRVLSELSEPGQVISTIVNKPGEGTKVVKNHLF